MVSLIRNAVILVQLEPLPMSQGRPNVPLYVVRMRSELFWQLGPAGTAARDMCS